MEWNVNEVVKKERSNLYLNSEIKEKAKRILSHYGLSLSDAVNIFLAQVVLENGIPFKVRIPNKETLKVMEETVKGKNLEEVSLEELVLEAESRVETKKT